MVPVLARMRQSGERDIGRSATQLSRPILQQNELDARENRNVAIIAFVEIGHPRCYQKEVASARGHGMQMNVSRKLLLNGIYCNEIEAPKPEFRDQAQQGTQALAHPCAADLSPVDWQRGLRRQFGREQAFGLENLTSEPFFSEFRVSNPVSKSSYRVAIRGSGQAAISVHARLRHQRVGHL